MKPHTDEDRLEQQLAAGSGATAGAQADGDLESESAAAYIQDAQQLLVSADTAAASVRRESLDAIDKLLTAALAQLEREGRAL